MPMTNDETRRLRMDIDYLRFNWRLLTQAHGVSAATVWFHEELEKLLPLNESEKEDCSYAAGKRDAYEKGYQDGIKNTSKTKEMGYMNGYTTGLEDGHREGAGGNKS